MMIANLAQRSKNSLFFNASDNNFYLDLATTGSCKNEAKITVSDRRTIRGKKVNGGVISVPACLGYGFYM